MPDNTHIRQVTFELESRAENDGLTLSGYAAVFDQVAHVNDWMGEYDEVIARGAFAKTIQERTPTLMFEHGRHPLIGRMPLGSIRSLKEDKKGLYLSARLHDNWLIEPVRDAIRSGSVSGMSFRFEAVKEAFDSSINRRSLLEVKMPELGPVVDPAYAGTSVSVRAAQYISEHDDILGLLTESLRDKMGKQATSDSDEAVREAGNETEPVTATRDKLELLKLRNTNLRKGTPDGYCPGVAR